MIGIRCISSSRYGRLAFGAECRAVLIRISRGTPGRPDQKGFSSIACLLYSLTMEARSEIPPGTLYMLILKTLMRLGPMHGYGIAQHIHRISEDVLHVEEGSLYPALQRMLIKGWLVAEWKQSENNRRARFYKLTPAGRKQLAAEMAEFEKVMGAITRVIQPA
jgi:PadR family transcriptional regulator, regulatory protein PadR